MIPPRTRVVASFELINLKPSQIASRPRPALNIRCLYCVGFVNDTCDSLQDGILNSMLLHKTWNEQCRCDASTLPQECQTVRHPRNFTSARNKLKFGQRYKIYPDQPCRHPIRSTPTFSQVTHFMIFAPRRPLTVYRVSVVPIRNGNNLADARSDSVPTGC